MTQAQAILKGLVEVTKGLEDNANVLYHMYDLEEVQGVQVSGWTSSKTEMTISYEVSFKKVDGTYSEATKNITVTL